MLKQPTEAYHYSFNLKSRTPSSSSQFSILQHLSSFHATLKLGQPSQFRYTQTPSKVIHLRNLPFDCVEEELVELCKPFGKVINTKCNVGANKNQAFVEFGNSVSFRTLRTSDGEARRDRIRTIGSLFQNFYMTGISTATLAKDALEGHCIYDGGYCKLHLSYSRHTDLNIKAYSDKCRDYTIPVPGFPTAGAAVWQNPSSAALATTVQPPVPGNQASSWDPTLSVRPGYLPAPGAFPGQGYPPPAYPVYPPSSMAIGSSPISLTNHTPP